MSWTYTDATHSVASDGQGTSCLASVLAQGTPINSYIAPLPSLSDYESAVQAALDAFAVLKGYRNSEAFATFANSTVGAWATEATAFCHWRDQCWTVAYTMLQQVNAGTLPQPSVAALLAALPAHP